MRKVPQFALLGQEVSSSLINNMFKSNRNDQAMNSGDYSDATNELKLWVSEELTEIVVDVLGLSENEAILTRRSLTQHIMILNDEKGMSEVAESLQLEGQLMGSILSFLWLSLINLTLVWITKEHEIEEEIELKDLETLINGDDCLFACNKNGRWAWKVWGDVMGLRPSVGKVFFTNEFCTLNSRMFALSDDGKWKDVPFISSSLLSGQEKSVRLGTEKEVDPLHKINDIGQRNFWLMWACPANMRYEVQKMFLTNNSALLKHPLIQGIDWFMPTWSGGLGICDVSESGWILNNTNFPGNPVPTYNDNMEPTGEYELYVKMRDENPQRKKSRQALFHMLMNWNKTKYRPVSWVQPKIPGNLDMLNVINKRMPSKPKEMLVSQLAMEPEDNINDQLFGLMAMDVYLTDKTTQDMIKNDYINAINNDFNNHFWVDKKSLYKLKDNEWEKEVELEGMGKKKRNRTIMEYYGNIYQNEHIKRVKYNRAIWKNNIKSGCSQVASYDKITSRKYLKVFRGTIKGKGANALINQMQEPVFNYIWDAHGPFSKEATEPQELW
jgi:hypothetical protein